MALNDVERWQDWLNQINNDLSTVYLYRAIWTTMAQTIDGNLAIPRTPALGMIASNYATTQAVAVRRLADLGRDTISFARLLTEIIAKPRALTARSALPAGEIVDILAWEQRFARAVPGGHVDPAPLERALAELTTAAESIRKYVDRHVAHRDRRPLATMPTFIDLKWGHRPPGRAVLEVRAAAARGGPAADARRPRRHHGRVLGAMGARKATAAAPGPVGYASVLTPGRVAAEQRPGPPGQLTRCSRPCAWSSGSWPAARPVQGRPSSAWPCAPHPRNIGDGFDMVIAMPARCAAPGPKPGLRSGESVDLLLAIEPPPTRPLGTVTRSASPRRARPGRRRRRARCT